MSAHPKLKYTRRNTTRERSSSVSRAARCELMRMKEDEDKAISEPEPMAMDKSAVLRAGASLMPSPTMAIVARLLRVLQYIEGNGKLKRDVCRFLESVRCRYFIFSAF